MSDIDEIYNGIAEALELYFKYTDGKTEPVEFRIKRQGAEALLELLKRQKPVVPDKPEDVWRCGECGEIVGWEEITISKGDVFYKYCPGCGRAVKWDAD